MRKNVLAIMSKLLLGVLACAVVSIAVGSAARKIAMEAKVPKPSCQACGSTCWCDPCGCPVAMTPSESK